MPVDVGQPLVQALVASATITAQLAQYLGGYPIFSRRPVPVDTPNPFIVVGQDVTITDNDGLHDFRPVIMRDVIAYGNNDSPDDYHQVEAVAYAIRDLFHRQPAALSVPNWNTIQIIATGPRAAPSDDDQTIGRAVTLNIQLAALR